MEMRVFPLGPYMVNCYLVWNYSNRAATLFDCGGENLDSIIEFLDNHSLTLENVILTHGHGDHIGGINKIINLYPEVKVYIGEEDIKFLKDPSLSLSQYIQNCEFIYSGHCYPLKGGDSIFGFEVIDTPGHTIGSKCFYNKEMKIIISGDTLFRRSYGRYDLPTGSFDDLQKSLRKLCNTFPPETVVYSAHSAPTTIGDEKSFLKGQGII
ncbi:Metallo-beta-lactamase superfamily protein [Cetobacterium ceti]|uniref:Metallo-beta-lactamase superfamily protein n=1 Tax=Cetobacterium ceti TaxID=180163 RepID=A0A1T4KN70_9FUSO|nr:MBL fold metallo-hydrolase [Cetobacterium ceti]SJZ43855.1 Metallo-beta-lactamase superfamily protein [Cetobacterium ceti]